MKIKKYQKHFHGNKSAMAVELYKGEIYFSIALFKGKNQNNKNTFDWQDKYAVKFNHKELCQIMELLRSVAHQGLFAKYCKVFDNKAEKDYWSTSHGFDDRKTSIHIRENDLGLTFTFSKAKSNKPYSFFVSKQIAFELNSWINFLLTKAYEECTYEYTETLELDRALADLRSCNTVAELKEIKNRYLGLAKNEKFISTGKKQYEIISGGVR